MNNDSTEKKEKLDGQYEWARDDRGSFVHSPVEFLMSGTIEVIWETLEGHVEVVVTNPLESRPVFIPPEGVPTIDGLSIHSICGPRPSLSGMSVTQRSFNGVISLANPLDLVIDFAPERPSSSTFSMPMRYRSDSPPQPTNNPDPIELTDADVTPSSSRISCAQVKPPGCEEEEQ